MKMEILLEPTSNKLLRTGKYGDFDGYTSDDLYLYGNYCQGVLLKMKSTVPWSVSRIRDQAKMDMETPRSSGVNSPPNAHT
ncbi:hypothetical protein Tco_0308398 [Tanacetum coccineum]